MNLIPILEHGLDETVSLLNRGFADYFVPIELSTAAFVYMMVHDGIDAGSSQVILHDDAPVGAALISRRGWTSRLAGMAIVPEARGKGIGKQVMDQLIAAARERGEKAMVLEVIEENVPGIRLYEGRGFKTVRRLVSYNASEIECQAEGELEEIDTRAAARMVTLHGLPDLPWQISGESLALSGPPGRAYRMDQAYIAISNPEPPHVGIRTLVVDPVARGQGQAAQLLRTVMARHPGKTWIVAALCPEEVGGVLESVGFERGGMSQLQMALEL